MGLICISLMISDTEHLYICLLTIRITSLNKNLFRSFAYFLIGMGFFLVLSSISSLQILDINFLLDVLANMFSNFVGCLFLSLMISFAVQKLFSLMYSNFFLFFLFSLPEGIYQKKYCYEPWWWF